MDTQGDTMKNEITTETCSRFQYLLDAKELTYEESMELDHLKTLVRKVSFWNLRMTKSR